jgi:hypothetical protein
MNLDQARLMPHLRQPLPPPSQTPLARNTSNTPTRPPHHRGHTTTATPGELRGIPVQTRGVGGAITGTRPDQEILH